MLQLHRGKFLHWQPSAVVSIDPSRDGTVVAVGRESGDIELWESEHWVLLQVRAAAPALAR